MRNFQRLASNVDTRPLLLALNTKRHLWNQYTLRTQKTVIVNDETIETPHREVDDVWLRMNPEIPHFDRRESVDYGAMAELPEARALIMALMADVKGERLGRCLISRLSPGLQIYPHVDINDDLSVYYDNEQYYSRFHIVLQGLPGSLFRCGEETVTMETGEVWWFDNAVEHSVVNNSKDDRIHLVVDIKVAK